MYFLKVTEFVLRTKIFEIHALFLIAYGLQVTA